jgi:hypothetical protein
MIEETHQQRKTKKPRSAPIAIKSDREQIWKDCVQTHGAVIEGVGKISRAALERKS